MKLRNSIRAIISGIVILTLTQTIYAREYAEHSVLATGSWTKIRVSETGVCKLSYDQIKEMGFSNPKEVHVYGYGGATLSEDFGQPKVDDLNEAPIYDSGTAIYFYAQGPRKWNYRGSNAQHAFDITSNPYSLYGYYFLTNNTKERKLISAAPLVEEAEDEMEITNYLEHISHKEETENIIESGIGWLGNQTPMGKGFTLEFETPDIDTMELGNLYVNLAAHSDKTSTAHIGIAGKQSELEIPLSGEGSEAMSREKTIVFLPSNEKNKLVISYVAVNGTDKLWIEQVVFSAYRKLKMNNGIMYFRNPNTEEAGTYKYILTGTNGSTIVWNITDPQNITQISTDYDGNELTFRRSPSQMEEFVAFNPASSKFVKAEMVGKVSNQDLHAIKDMDFIIITNEAFISEAQRLASIHEEHDNANVLVVTPEEIYNEFSSGTPDASAIRWFLKMFYDRGEYNKQVLLLGDGSFDNRGILRSSGSIINNFIITYQGGSKYAESNSYVSDDYFCCLSDRNNGLLLRQMKMDYGIGRFPVSTLEQATSMVNKVEKYLTTKKYGKWKNKAMLVADDNEEGVDANRYNKFFAYSDNIGKIIHQKDSAIEIQKVHFDSYTRVTGSNGNKYPEVEEIISKNIQDGILLMNYIGHSGELAWSSERVFTQNQAATIFNDKQGFWFTASCRFAVFDKSSSSAGEDLVTNPNGGALTLFCAARTVYDGPNDNLNRAYAYNLFNRDENKMPLRIGDICKEAKNTLENDSNKLSYTLLGDPMLRICYPKGNVLTDSIKSINGSHIDTIRAFSEIKVYGHIEDEQNNFMDNFNGQLDITLYDKELTLTTKGNRFETEEEKEKNKHRYTDRLNILFSGKAEVKDGQFSFVLKVPKDINYNFGTGRFHYYAMDESLDYDADGSDENFIIGGSDENETMDNCGPDIKIHMNHTAFLSGDKTNNTPVLYAEVSDKNGINSSGSGIGHDITLTLNEDKTPIILNKEFSYDLDSYSNGSIVYQFSSLEPGHYTATLKVWDLLNNSSQKSIEFVVEEESIIRTDKVTITPAVAKEKAEVKITHDMPQTVQTYSFIIYNSLGKIVREEQPTQTRIDQDYTWEWDLKDSNGRRVPEGAYLVRVEHETAEGDHYGLTQKMIVTSEK